MKHHLSPSTVFFDAVGTLFSLKGPVGQVYLEQAWRHGFPLRRQGLAVELTAAFRAAFKAQGPLAFPGEPLDRIPELERRWWREVVSRTFAPFGPFPQLEPYFEDLFEFFGTGEPWQLEPGVREVLSKLTSRGKRLGVVTNYDSRVIAVLGCLSIGAFFEAVVVSSLAGVAKPDPRVFKEACSRLGCDPAQTLHVGDELGDDARAAQKAGLKSLLYDPADRFPGSNPRRIRRLEELIEILV